MHPLRFHLSRHSAIRASERDLRVEDLKEAAINPDRKRRCGRGVHGGTIYEFTKRINNGSLICIAEIKNAECWIITGYYEQT